jgi:hypothetical protein
MVPDLELERTVLLAKWPGGWAKDIRQAQQSSAVEKSVLNLIMESIDWDWAQAKVTIEADQIVRARASQQRTASLCAGIQWYVIWLQIVIGPEPPHRHRTAVQAVDRRVHGRLQDGSGILRITMHLLGINPAALTSQ